MRQAYGDYHYHCGRCRPGAGGRCHLRRVRLSQAFCREAAIRAHAARGASEFLAAFIWADRLFPFLQKLLGDANAELEEMKHLWWIEPQELVVGCFARKKILERQSLIFLYESLVQVHSRINHGAWGDIYLADWTGSSNCCWFEPTLTLYFCSSSARPGRGSEAHWRRTAGHRRQGGV